MRGAILTWLRKLLGQPGNTADKIANPEVGARALQLGLVHAGRGQWTEAAEAFRTTIRHASELADAHHNLSIALSHLGYAESAFSEAQTAAQLNRNRATLLNLGNTAARVQELDVAAESFSAILELDPYDTACRYNLGIILHAQGRWDEAILELTAIQFSGKPRVAADLLLAAAYRHTGAYRAAGALIDARLKDNPEHLDLHIEQARLLCAIEEWQASLDAADKALGINPDSCDALVIKAETLNRLGDLESSEQCLIRAHNLQPDHIGVRLDLANLLSQRERKDEAKKLYLEVFEQDPQNLVAAANLGILCMDQADYREALLYFEHVLNIDPKHGPTLTNIGRLHFEIQQLEEAVHFLKRALTVNENDSRAIFGLAQTYLAQGKLAEGWDLSDHPLSKGRKSALAWIDPARDWTNQPLAGKRLRIRPEQGIGDEILFSTCYPDAIREAGSCTIECDPRLNAILKRTFPTAEIIPVSLEDRVNGDFPVYDFDLECLAGSLPRRYRRTHESFPKAKAFLETDPDLRQKWESRLNALGHAFKIGICWRSEVVDFYRMRSSHYTHLEDWGSVFAIPDTSFVNLYYGKCEYEISQAQDLFGVNVKCWEDLDLREDLDDVLALIASLDLIITTQTAVWNMAGAVGQDSIVLFSPNSQLGTDYVPWHRSIEPITSGKTKPWDEVSRDIAERVKMRIKRHRQKQ